MTRALRLTDIAWLLDVQPAGEWLEIEDRVLTARSPRQSALHALMPAADQDRAVIVDIGLCESDQALALLRMRPGRLAADLLYVWPPLEQAAGVALTWARVVAEACHWLGRQGTHRVYTAVAQDDRLALQVFRQIGFVVYTGDEVLCLPSLTVEENPAGEPAAGTRDGPLDPASERAVRSMIEAGLGDAARGHLPTAGADWDEYPLAGRACRGILSGARLAADGSVAGGWRVVAGRAGSWLRLAGRDGASCASALVGALRTMVADPRFRSRPVYASARGYEPEVHLALREAGFEAVAGRFRMVRHSTVRVLAPAWEPRSRRGHALGTKPTTYVPIRETPAAEGGRR